MKITVFTPTYNRAHTLKRLYESLEEQTYRDFEWIVIDDGSQDNTEELIKNIKQAQPSFPITYEKTINGGKHRAINKGVWMAEGELFYIVDSDDYLPKEALQTIKGIAEGISDDEKGEYAGLCGIRVTISDGTQIGTTFKGLILDATYLEAKEHNVSGDKADIYYTDVLKRFPFPEFDNEKFIPESVVWNKIASEGLKLRYFNIPVYCGEYLDDGLTAQGDKKIINNPKGYGLHLQQLVSYKIINRMNKWNALYKYYCLLKEETNVFQIAKNLSFNPVIFYFRMIGMRIFYRLYR